MSLDLESIKKIAFLARLKIPDEEAEILCDELNTIIDWVEQLSSVDTENTEAMTSVAKMELNRREDANSVNEQRENILANSPHDADLYFSVPKVVE